MISLKNELLMIAMFMALLVSCKKEEIKTEEKIPGIVVDNMDNTVSPSEDFFRYVNGSWVDKTEIPADRTSWGSFNELRKKTDSDVLNIMNKAIEEDNFPKLKDAEGNLTMESDQRKAVNFYATIMDTISRNEQGTSPLKPFLERIDQLENIDDLQQLMIELEPYGGIGYFNFSVFNDLKNSKMNAGYLVPAGLGLSRDYYVDEDEDTKGKREKYKAHIARMLQFFGEKEEEATAKAERIFQYEYKLAVPRLTKEERRDARKLYNPMTISELSEYNHCDAAGIYEGRRKNHKE